MILDSAVLATLLADYSSDRLINSPVIAKPNYSKNFLCSAQTMRDNGDGEELELEVLGSKTYSSQCPVPNSQCPMPNAQFPMPNAQCPMPNAALRPV
ncbi:MAG: hypothetical protein V7L04_15670 [Nostoc sp.]|uniref:hypothetical protein n=1 Tax=unclassified Nostoc TaxID=2593658 RepID=UPI0026262A19|nr:hypothetical protein [Nostoc sp. S13]MDF5736345.1 hypothetical protein [Nostoc sp. S13]